MLPVQNPPETKMFRKLDFVHHVLIIDFFRTLWYIQCSYISWNGCCKGRTFSYIKVSERMVSLLWPSSELELIKCRWRLCVLIAKYGSKNSKFICKIRTRRLSNKSIPCGCTKLIGHGLVCYIFDAHTCVCLKSLLFNPLRPRQIVRHFSRRQFQIRFLEWKCTNFA